MLDWFHVAMRLRHLKHIAGALPAYDPARVAAKAVIVEDVERLHWRIWNGKAKMPKSASIVSARSYTIFRASRISEGLQRPHASCGPRCARWIAI